MKVIEQYFLVVLFVLPYGVVLTVESVDQTLIVANQIKAMVLFILLHSATFESVDQTLKCHHSNESY